MKTIVATGRDAARRHDDRPRADRIQDTSWNFPTSSSASTFAPAGYGPDVLGLNGGALNPLSAPRRPSGPRRLPGPGHGAGRTPCAGSPDGAAPALAAPGRARAGTWSCRRSCPRSTVRRRQDAGFRMQVGTASAADDAPLPVRTSRPPGQPRSRCQGDRAYQARPRRPAMDPRGPPRHRQTGLRPARPGAVRGVSGVSADVLRTPRWRRRRREGRRAGRQGRRRLRAAVVRRQRDAPADHGQLDDAADQRHRRVPGQPPPKTVAPGAVVVAAPARPAAGAPKEEMDKYAKDVARAPHEGAGHAGRASAVFRRLSRRGRAEAAVPAAPCHRQPRRPRKPPSIGSGSTPRSIREVPGREMSRSPGGRHACRRDVLSSPFSPPPSVRPDGPERHAARDRDRRDPGGAPSARSRWPASSRPTSLGRLTAATDRAGAGEVRNLAPGRYSVTAEFSGFQTRTLPDVRIRAGENKQVVMLPIDRLQSDVTVDRDRRPRRRIAT